MSWEKQKERELMTQRHREGAERERGKNRTLKTEPSASLRASGCGTQERKERRVRGDGDGGADREALLEALRKSGYTLRREGEATAEEKVRRMLRRFSMQAADAEVLLGMVRKILWKLEQK